MVIEAIPIVFRDRYLAVLQGDERQLVISYDELIGNIIRPGMPLVYVPGFTYFPPSGGSAPDIRKRYGTRSYAIYHPLPVPFSDARNARP
jgi:hypothetical protein